MDPFAETERSPLEQIASDVATIRYYAAFITLLLFLGAVAGVAVWIAAISD